QDVLFNVNQNIVDSLGRVIRPLDAQSGLTQQLYDGAGNVVIVIDPDNNITTLVYDGLNRQVFQIDPYNGVTTPAYDPAGAKTLVDGPLGREQLFGYDADNRLTAVTWKATGGATVNNLTYTYDAKGNRLIAQDSGGTVSYSYDALDRVQAAQNVFGQV